MNDAKRSIQGCLKLCGIALCGLAIPWLGGCAQSSYNKDFPLMTAPANQWGRGQAQEIFGKLQKADKPIVVYVTGRGNEPAKSIKADTLADLEHDNNVVVLMFMWDSRAPLWFRPVDKAEAGGAGLKALLTELGAYRRTHLDMKPVTLLVHSMGSIVLQRAVESDGGQCLADESGTPTFQNILLTEPDANRDGHASWVQKLRVSPTGKILITINRNDGVLAMSEYLGGGSPLGRGTPDMLTLAPNVAYVDLTGLAGKRHRVFELGRLHDQVNAGEIINHMLRGKDPKLANGTTQDPSRPNWFNVLPRQDSSHPLFKNASKKDDSTDNQD